MQHFRRFAATVVVGSLIGAALGAAGFGAGQGAHAQALPPAEAAATGNPYVQRGVPAEATAENAVVARTRALAAAQRTAYERMAGELGLPRGLSDSQIDSLVSSIIVEEERTTRNGYNGRLTVNFSQSRVAARSGGVAGGPSTGPSPGLPPGGDAAPPVVPAAQQAAGFIQAEARFGGQREWLELRRRLLTSPEIASVDIQAIAVDGARLRLGLRQAPQQAMQALPATGLVLVPPAPLAPNPFAAPAAPGMLAPPVRVGAAPNPAAVVPDGAGASSGPWQIGLAGRI
ncbi:hypothetical protein CR162_10885 [Pseudoroseomonas rhizosphaerae]|uniref:Uncharacterized protein n=1 Tax=Teichococcus rhizosphaerae TaxID=1335062 RepID=A0A2C7ABB7_9PROT|nr:hypothetical protein [Pseudoroseomonas rhizosphaerae]PHK94933.1 hypothetical protein CR162_10885 [Pseudoroseomonas rhizosphaerae]